MNRQLPPGPRAPSLLQSIGWWARPTAYLERCRARYGQRFTIRLVGQSPFVILSDPAEIKQVFTAAPEVLHPGEGARILEPVIGANSVILLDEAAHLRQRKLLLPAFHGEKMQRLSGLMAELAEREVESWPLEQPTELHPRLQRLTLEVILRAVFGLRRGAQLDELRDLTTQVLAFGESPLSLIPQAQRLLAGRGPVGRMERVGARADELIYRLIDERRAAGEDGAEGDDVLSMLLAARDEDGEPMSPRELRDELVTMLVAGHETTASQLAWAMERIAREPSVQLRLHEELDGDSDEAYLTATINEILRRRPVVPNAEPRLVKQPIEIGDTEYQPGTVLFASAYLVHHDPAIYPDPLAFRPERFLDEAPGTYTWIPFGGGRRRCLGASFALLEMKIVLRAALALHAERARRRPGGHAQARHHVQPLGRQPCDPQRASGVGQVAYLSCAEPAGPGTGLAAPRTRSRAATARAGQHATHLAVALAPRRAGRPVGDGDRLRSEAGEAGEQQFGLHRKAAPRATLGHRSVGDHLPAPAKCRTELQSDRQCRGIERAGDRFDQRHSRHELLPIGSTRADDVARREEFQRDRRAALRVELQPAARCEERADRGALLHAFAAEGDDAERCA
jgi:cytochrome P450